MIERRGKGGKGKGEERRGGEKGSKVIYNRQGNKAHTSICTCKLYKPG